MPDPKDYAKYQEVLTASAQSYGVPESVLVRLLFLGDYKDSGEDPYDLIPKTASELRDYAQMFNGDYERAVAAYYTSPQDVSKAQSRAVQSGGITGFIGKKDWRDFLPEEARVSTANVWQKGNPTIPPELISETFKPISRSTVSRDVPPGQIPEPRFSDFLDTYGDVATASTAYYEALAQVKALRSQDANDAASYLDLITQSLSADIASRNLSLAQANAEFGRRLDALQVGGDLFTGLLKYTIPPTNNGYVYGSEPGGFAESIGLPNVRAQPINIDPIGMANEIVRSSPSTNVGTPDLSELNRLKADYVLEQALKKARGTPSASSLNSQLAGSMGF